MKTLYTTTQQETQSSQFLEKSDTIEQLSEATAIWYHYRKKKVCTLAQLQTADMNSSFTAL